MSKKTIGETLAELRKENKELKDKIKAVIEDYKELGDLINYKHDGIQKKARKEVCDYCTLKLEKLLEEDKPNE